MEYPPTPTENYLQEILPAGYNYTYQIINDYEDGNENYDRQFEAEVRANIFTGKDVEKWLAAFEDSSKLNFRVAKTSKSKGVDVKKIIFKKNYRCHHNTRATTSRSKTKQPSAKHTNCEATLRITVKNSSMKRSKDALLKDYPCAIYIKHTHNHLIESADILRFRRPNEETKLKVKKLYEEGYLPSSALKIIKNDLQEKYGCDYLTKAADGSICPSLQWMFHFYYSNFKRHHDSPDALTEVEPLNALEETINQDQNQNILEEEEEDTPVNQNDISIEEENRLTEPSSEIMEVEEKLNSFVEKIKKDMKENPKVFAAVKEFLSIYEDIKTESALISSLANFGKKETLKTRKRKFNNVQSPAEISIKNNKYLHLDQYIIVVAE